MPTAKIKTLPEEVQATLWELTTVAMDGREKPMTLEEARAWLLATHGVDTSQGAMSNWRSWYALQLRTERKKAVVEQAVEELAKSDPSKTLEELHAFGQVLFTSEAIEEKDAKAFTEVWRASEKSLTRKQAKEMSEADRALRERALSIDERKLAILEQKAAFADEVKKKASENREGGLSAEDMADIERRLKLM